MNHYDEEEPSDSTSEFGLPYIVIPGEILFNPTLTPNERLLFGFLVSLSRQKKGCVASNNYLASRIFCQPQTVTNAITKLQKQGYLKVKYVQKSSTLNQRHIYINDTYKQTFRPLVEKWHEIKDQAGVNMEKTLEGAIKSIIAPYYRFNTRDKKRDKNTLTKVRVEVPCGNDNSLISVKANDSPALTILRRKKVITKSHVKPLLQTYPGKYKIIIDHWNQQSNLPSLQTKRPASKSFLKVTSDIKSILEKNSVNKIKESISTYDELMGDNYSLRTRKGIGECVSLSEFFAFSPYTKKKAKSFSLIRKNKVSSWFRESLRTQEYLDKTYGLYSKDLNSRVTQVFKDMFLDPYLYAHPPDWPERFFKEAPSIEAYGWSVEEENRMRLATKRLLHFLKTYGVGNGGNLLRVAKGEAHTPSKWVLYVYRAISEDLGDQEFQPSMSWLTSKATYEQRLPDFFKEHTTMEPQFIPLRMDW